MQAIRPGKNIYTKSFLCLADIGCRTDRTAISSCDGGGIFSRKYTQINRGTEKVNPVTKGSQNSFVPRSCVMYPAIVFTKPDENIKLTERAAPIKSVVLLP